MSKHNRLYNKLFNLKKVPRVNFLLGTAYNKNNPNDRRNILLNFLESNQKYNFYNFIVETIDFNYIDNIYNIDSNFFGFNDYKIYEQLLGEISDNIIIFLDSVSSGFEFGMFTMTYDSSLKNIILVPETKNNSYLPVFIKDGPIKNLNNLFKIFNLNSKNVIEYKYQLDNKFNSEFNKKIKYINFKNNSIDKTFENDLLKRINELYKMKIINGEINEFIKNILQYSPIGEIEFKLSINLLFKIINVAFKDNKFKKFLISSLWHSQSREFVDNFTTIFIEAFFKYIKYLFNFIGIKLNSTIKIVILSSINEIEINFNNESWEKDIEYLENNSIFLSKFDYWKIKMVVFFTLLFLAEKYEKDKDLFIFLITNSKNDFFKNNKLVITENNIKSSYKSYLIFEFVQTAKIICNFLGIEEREINYSTIFEVFNSYNNFYTQFKINKQNEKIYNDGNVKKRDIVTYKDSKQGSKIQIIHRKFLKKLYKTIKMHRSCFSYIRNKNIYMAAAVHLESNVFLKLDIKSFFSSINLYKLFNKLIDNKNFRNTRIYRDIFFKLFSNNKKGLPIGLVCSGYLSNIYLNEFDIELNKYLKGLNRSLKYTRYADDILISSRFYKHQNLFEDIKLFIEKFLKSLNLKINKSKERIVSFKKYNHIKYLGINITKNHQLTIGKSFRINFYIKCISFIVNKSNKKNNLLSNKDKLNALKSSYLHIKNAEKKDNLYILKDFLFYFNKVIKYKIKKEQLLSEKEIKKFFLENFN